MQIFIAVVLANDHTLVHNIAVADEHHATLGQIQKRECRRCTSFNSDQNSILSLARSESNRSIVAERMVHHSFATSCIENSSAQTDQTARWNICFNMSSRSAHIQLGDFSASLTKQFQRTTHHMLSDIERKFFIGFVHHAINFAFDDFWFANCQFKSFTSHRFQKHSKMQQASSRNVEFFSAITWRNAQRNIGTQFFFESLSNLATGHEFSFTPNEWAVINAENHVKCGIIDLHSRHWKRAIRQTHSVADLDICNALDCT